MEGGNEGGNIEKEVIAESLIFKHRNWREMRF